MELHGRFGFYSAIKATQSFGDLIGLRYGLAMGISETLQLVPMCSERQGHSGLWIENRLRGSREEAGDLVWRHWP